MSCMMCVSLLVAVVQLDGGDVAAHACGCHQLSVGKEASLAIPHSLLMFLAIRMYPSIPQYSPQLREREKRKRIGVL